MHLNNNVLNENVNYAYYEEKYQLGEKHDRLLDILTEFDAFCRKNDIHYSLADGTLLGAIRHADFIPWDDDADVMMTRAEYERLKKVLTPDTKVQMCKVCFLDRITLRGYGEQGLYMDMFINEDMPESKPVFAWMKFKTRFLRTYFNKIESMNARHSDYRGLKKLTQSILGTVGHAMVSLLIGKRDIFEVNDKAVAIRKHRPSGFYTRFTSRMYETNRRFNKQSYEEGYADILFRGKRLMAIKNAKVFLHEMYGNFDSMPPEEKRVPEHSINMLEAPADCKKWFN